MIQPALATSNKYDTVIKIGAADITIKGLDISNALGVVDTGGLPGGTHIEHHGIWDGSWTVGQPGLTVDDCKFHDIEHGVRSYGDEFTVTNSEFYRLGRTGVYASGYGASSPLVMTVKNNWFHDYIPVWKENHGVHVKYDGRVGEVSYNYMSGMRMGIAYYYGGPKSGFGQIVFRHNTFDLDYDLDGGTKPMTMGISLYGTGANADNILIQDNIFANAQWYGIYQEDEDIVGSITVDNNLFYNNYWYYWPESQYPYQWFGDDTKAQAGWTGGAGGFTFTNNITAQDPLFALTGVGPEEQWALTCRSPAYHTATDGMNIGAWQGELVCAGTITIIKDAVPDDPQDFDFTGDLGNFPLDDDPGDATLPNSRDFVQAAGTYNVTETPIPAGWNLAVIGCVDPDGGTTTNLGTATATIDLDVTEHITCTFTNTKPGTITIIKDAVPDDPQDFDFTGDLGNFSLDDDADPTLPNSGTFTRDLGTYNVAETVPPSWDLDDISCTTNDPNDTTVVNVPGGSVTIDLDGGEDITCTFTNTKPGTITIIKAAVPDDPQDFDFTGDLGNFSLDDDADPTLPNSRDFVQAAGTYNVTETPIPAGWNLAVIGCVDPDGGTTTNLGTATATIDLDPGEHVTCTFTNEALDTDGDGVLDIVEGTGDRDGDGIPDYLDYDPTGYFYNEITGQIIPGGQIAVTGPGVVTIVQDGSGGFYQFTTDGTAGTYTIQVTLPRRWGWSGTCLRQDPPPFDPTGGPNPTVLGNGENGATGFLVSNACTDYYLSFDLEAQDPFIFNNNFPLSYVPPVPIGGIVVPVNRLELLAPWLGLAALASLAALTAALVKRHRA